MHICIPFNNTDKRFIKNNTLMPKNTQTRQLIYREDASHLQMQMFCLVVWGLSSHSRIFHSYGDVTITGEGLQIFTYARHS